MAKSTTIILLPPSMRHRLTLRGALLGDPRRYLKNMMNTKSITFKKTKLKDRRSKAITVTVETQTVDVNIGTKMKRFVRAQSAKKLRASKFRAWRKRSKLTSPSFILEPVRELRGILKPDSFPKNSLGEMKFKERKRSSVSKILKKRVKVEKKPMVSYISREMMPEESLCSLGKPSEDKPINVVLAADDMKSSTTFTSASTVATESAESTDGFHHSLDLERKSARCFLDQAPSAHSARKRGARDISIYRMTNSTRREKRPSSSSLDNLEKLRSSARGQLAPTRVPKDRLYFRNVVWVPARYCEM